MRCGIFGSSAARKDQRYSEPRFPFSRCGYCSMLNYRHLYCFWIVARKGGLARAAERLKMAVQAISAQVRELEKALRHQLLKPAGRGGQEIQTRFFLPKASQQCA